jgi:hypothetical protein
MALDRLGNDWANLTPEARYLSYHHNNVRRQSGNEMGDPHSQIPSHLLDGINRFGVTLFRKAQNIIKGGYLP